MANSEKRKRSTNFSTSEIELLVDLIVNRYAKIIENKVTDSITWKQKEAAWTSLSLDFNAQSDTNRNEKTLKMKYEGLKKNLKKKYAANKFEIYKTGGGEASEFKYESYEEKLLSILTINIEGLPCEVDSDKNDVYVEASMPTNAEINGILIVEEGSFNLPDADIQILDQDIIIAESGPSLVCNNMPTGREIDQEEIFKENIEFNTPSTKGNGKKKNISTWTPETLKRPISKKLTAQKPKEQINDKFYMLADGRSELLKQQLIIAEKEMHIKDLEIKIKERELEYMQKVYELKMKILEKKYDNL